MTKNSGCGRIILFADRLSPSIGGMEAHADAFIEYFSSCPDWQLSSILTFEKDSFPAAQEITGQSEKEQKKYLVPVKFLSKDSMFDPQEIFQVIDSLNLGSNDIIFFNSLYWIRIFDELHKRYPHVRIFLRSGGNDIVKAQIDGKGEALSGRQRFVVNMINTTVHRLVVNSQYSYQRLAGLGIEQQRMVIMRGGVDVAHFTRGTEEEHDEIKKELSIPKDTTIILAACRLVPFKGIEDTINALKLLPPSLHFHYVIIGDGPLKNEVEAQIKNSGLEDRITLRSAVRHEEIPRYFRGADIYCLTPVHHVQNVTGGSYVHTETMGRSFCEAGAAALPSISTQVGGIPEIVYQEETGYLVPERSPKLIAEKLEILISNHTIRETMGAQARSLSEEKFSWDVLFSHYKNIFQK